MLNTTKNKVNEAVKQLFQKNAVFDGVPVMVTSMPEELFEELKTFKDKCDNIKNSKFNFLREHVNEGENTYQVSVPNNLIEQSLIFPFIIHLGQYYLLKLDNISLDESRRRVTLRKVKNHFDGYDFWINYSNKGNANPKHFHCGGKGLSGIIYFTESQTPTVFDDKINFYGSPGQVVIFPASLEHSVPEQEEIEERVTFAFNLGIDIDA